MPFIHIRGIRLAYEDLGQGEAMVFVHGHPFNRSMWSYQSAFAGTHRLILPDLRGYGQTEDSSPVVLLDDMALDIAHLLDELGIARAVFCGLSMGGQIVLDFYRMFPHRVRALVIADSDARGESEESLKKRHELIALIERIGMEKYTNDHIHEYIAPASLEKEEIYAHLRGMMASTRAESAIAAHRGRAVRRDHLKALASVDVPVLLVVGSEDYFTPRPVMELMRERLPRAELVCVEGAGHLPNMEAPEAFNQALDNFLRKYSL